MSEIPKNLFDQEIVDTLNTLNFGTIGFYTLKTRLVLDFIQIKPVVEEERFT